MIGESVYHVCSTPTPRQGIIQAALDCLIFLMAVGVLAEGWTNTCVKEHAQ